MECEASMEQEIADALQFGAKSIGMLGSIAVLLNNILGPGIANFSGLYQQTGWLPPSFTILICVISSMVSGDMLLAAMRAYPENSEFGVRVEYGTLCRHYFSRKTALLFQCLFQLAMLCANISNIIQTAQVLDYFVADLNHGKSCAVMFYPNVEAFCHTSSTDVTPFGTDKIVLSLGMGIVALLSIPLGYYNLEDNVVVQNVAMVVILLSTFAWFSIFASLGLDRERVPLIGSSLHNMGGTILFNFMFISTIPSWVCEKKPTVRPLMVIGITLLMAALVSVQAYAISANLASIPIFSILMRYNLIESHVCGPKAAGAVSVLLPFGVSVLLYTGEGFKDIVDFSGTFTSALVNLMVPSLLFLAALHRDDINVRTNVVEELSARSARLRARSAAWSASSCVASNDGPSGLRKLWRIIAWVNLLVMVALTTVCVDMKGVTSLWQEEAWGTSHWGVIFQLGSGIAYAMKFTAIKLLLCSNNESANSAHRPPSKAQVVFLCNPVIGLMSLALVPLGGDWTVPEFSLALAVAAAATPILVLQMQLIQLLKSPVTVAVLAVFHDLAIVCYFVSMGGESFSRAQVIGYTVSAVGAILYSCAKYRYSDLAAQDLSDCSSSIENDRSFSITPQTMRLHFSFSTQSSF
eukprot:g28312.t1